MHFTGVPLPDDLIIKPRSRHPTGESCNRGNSVATPAEAVPLNDLREIPAENGDVVEQKDE